MKGGHPISPDRLDVERPRDVHAGPYAPGALGMRASDDRLALELDNFLAGVVEELANLRAGDPGRGGGRALDEGRRMRREVEEGGCAPGPGRCLAGAARGRCSGSGRSLQQAQRHSGVSENPDTRHSPARCSNEAGEGRTVEGPDDGGRRAPDRTDDDLGLWVRLGELDDARPEVLPDPRSRSRSRSGVSLGDLEARDRLDGERRCRSDASLAPLPSQPTPQLTLSE
jgi:hypothetical protein